jgi:hypothetical protein
MKTKQFIEKAIEGGMKTTCIEDQYPEMGSGGYMCNGSYTTIEKLILDPKAWEAVGKVEGYSNKIRVRECSNCFSERVMKEQTGLSCECLYNEEWKQKMHEMIDHLIEGGTIETYLKTL